VNSKDEKLYEKVKGYILHLNALSDDEFAVEAGHPSRFLTKEWLAKKFKVKDHKIERCFQLLNQEGYMQQPVQKACEDGWAPNRYYLKTAGDRWFGAVRRKDKDKIKRMLDEGMDINFSNHTVSALKIAMSTRDLSLISFLLENGADPSSYENLSYAVSENNAEILKLVLSYAKDPFVEDDLQETILFNACAHYPQMVRTLLDHGFDVNHKNKLNETPLMIASSFDQVEAFSFLIENGASIKTKDAHKNTAFTIAYKSDSQRVLRQFIPLRGKLSREEKVLFKKIRLRLFF